VIKRVQLLDGTATLKFASAKNVQNLVRFTTTFEFDRKYLWTGWRYRQAVNGVIKAVKSALNKKNCVNFLKLTPSITRQMFTYPNQIIWKTIFRPLGGAAPQIFTGAREW